MSEQEPQSEIIPDPSAENPTIEPVKELSSEEAYIESCQRVRALEADLKDAKVENSRLAFENSKENRQLTLAECNANARRTTLAMDKDRVAATNYAASRGLVLAAAPVSSPSPRLPKTEGK